MTTPRQRLRSLVREELVRSLREQRGNVQSEPEFGDMLDALRALEGKGFGLDEIEDALAQFSRGPQGAGR